MDDTDKAELVEALGTAIHGVLHERRLCESLGFVMLVVEIGKETEKIIQLSDLAPESVERLLTDILTGGITQ